MAYNFRKRARISYDLDVSPNADEEDDQLAHRTSATGNQQHAPGDEAVHDDQEWIKGSSKKNKSLKGRKPRARPHEPKVPEKPFPFTQLPAELRNKIYELCLLPAEHFFNLVLVDSHDRPRVVQRSSKWSRSRHRESYAQVLRLSQQIHDESASLLYSCEMKLLNCNSVSVFVAQIGLKNARLLRNITFRNPSWSAGTQAHIAFNTLMLATNLERLTLDCVWLEALGHKSDRYYATADAEADGAFMARKLYRYASNWFHSMAITHGKKDAGASILQFPDSFFLRTGLVRDPSKTVTAYTAAYGLWQADLGCYDVEKSKEIQLANVAPRKASFKRALARLLEEN